MSGKSVRVLLLTTLLALSIANDRRTVYAQSKSIELSDQEFPRQEQLPDLLVLKNGKKITTKEEWQSLKKPELTDSIQKYMYGYLPPIPKKIEAELLFENRQALDGLATLQEFALKVGPKDSPPIYLLLAIPNKRIGKVPTFIGINFCGNHAVLPDKQIHLPTIWMYPTNNPKNKGGDKNRANEGQRGSQVRVWNIEETIKEGYAVATFYNGDLDPDRSDKREGIRPYLPKSKANGEDSTSGSIAVWAWGVHRVVDFLLQRKEIDESRLIVVGHSRLGKTALLAGALDERIAMVMPHQAGCGGTAPSRGKMGESVRQINERFPHWFCGYFKKFNNCPDRLPFDQHALVALCAPRPVLFSNAKEDSWSNPMGQFEVLHAANPVYALYHINGITAKQPELGHLINSHLGYYYREGKHSMTAEDWKVFIQFANAHLTKYKK